LFVYFTSVLASVPTGTYGYGKYNKYTKVMAKTEKGHGNGVFVFIKISALLHFDLLVLYESLQLITDLCQVKL